MDNTRSAAVMFTDIFGYTRMMGEDENQTLALLEIHKKSINAAVNKHNGSIIKMIGDAFLILFDDSASAVACALQIQNDQAQYNQQVEQSKRFQIRIGIHYGTVTHREDDVFGTGVNVASRLEPHAVPGGICISEPVFQLSKDKQELQTYSLGHPKLKNVAEPLEVLHIITESITRDIIKTELHQRKESQRRQQRIVTSLAGLAVLALVVVAVILYRPATVGLAPELPEVPLIENRVAVLPLRNETGDTTKAYLAEGVADQLIFQLSQIQDLYVYPISDVLSLSERHRNVNGIKRGLGAKYMVSGTLLERADSMVVLLEIVDTERAIRVLAQEYTSPYSNAADIHTSASRDII